MRSGAWDRHADELARETDESHRGSGQGGSNECERPLLRGRVQVQLPYAGVPEEWAQVVITPVSGIQPRFAVGDQVLVAFEEGNVRLPYVLGELWNGAPVPQVTGVPQVHLPTGSTLQPVVESANASQQCGMTADLERQVAPWLASAECLLKILALLKPLIDVIEQLPNPKSLCYSSVRKRSGCIAAVLANGNSDRGTSLGSRSAVPEPAIVVLPARLVVASLADAAGCAWNPGGSGSWPALLCDRRCRGCAVVSGERSHCTECGHPSVAS